jgi:DNA-binding SARP family transcriptional activator/Tfp pilus assembly protein PilF/DNA-binding Lrp family transcriptional regulator
MLAIHLLGPPQILMDGQTLNVSRRKSRALVYYLADQQKPVTREHLISVFWSDLERQAAFQNLRTTLYGLRQDLGDEFLAEADQVALSSQIQVDTHRFSQHLESQPAKLQQLKSALDLYRGDFLQDFSLPDSLPFEEWLTVEREHYRRLFMRGLQALAQLYEAANDFRAAIDVLERALAFNPLQEDLQREVIHLYYLAGDRPGAIQRYDQLRRLLDEELGVPPMAETRHLYDAIVTGTLEKSTISAAKAPQRPLMAPGREADQTGNLPFAGRQPEVAQIHQAMEAGKLALIEGEPGIGKTRLANEILHAQPVLALAGAARELEQTLPYQPVIEALRGLLTRPDWPRLQSSLTAELLPVWLHETGRLLPELELNAPRGESANWAGSRSGVTDPSANESRLWEAISQFLIALGRQKPVILFIDDLQWADAATLGLLGHLVHQSHHAQVSFLAASRPVPLRSPLAVLTSALIREHLMLRISLDRLSEKEVVEVARGISQEFAYPLGDWLYRLSEGNPYVLVELIRYGYAQDIIRRQPQGGHTVNLSALSSSTVVPQTVYSLIQARLEQLTETTRRILNAAAISGRIFEFEIVANAAGVSENAALDALDELRQAGLVSYVESGHYEFNHNMTVEVAIQEISQPRRRLMHRRIAEAMQAIYTKSRRDTMVGVIAGHFVDGDAPERAVPYAYQAGEQAAELAAWTEASAFFEQALSGATGQARFPILIDLGSVLLQAGKQVQASEAFREALHLAEGEHDPARINKARLALAQSILAQARFQEAIQLARQVLESGRQEEAIDAEFIWGAALSVEGGDLEAAQRHLKAAERLCPTANQATSPGPAGLEVNLGRVKFELGSVAAQQGNLERAVANYQEAIEASCENQDETSLAWCILAHNNLAYHLLLMKDPQAEKYARVGLKLAQENGMLGQQPYLFSTLGEIALANSDLESAKEFFRQGLRLALRLSMFERVAGITANLGLLALEQGDLSLAIHRLSSALSRADQLGTRHLAAQIRLWLAPLLPEEEGRRLLEEARAFAEGGQRRLLLEQAERLEAQFNHKR